MTMQRATYQVQPFLQDRSAFYTTQQGLPSNQVLAMVRSGDSLWAATDQGIARLKLPAGSDARWEKASAVKARALLPDGGSGIYAAAENGVQRILASGEATPVSGLESARIQQLAPAQGGGFFALASDKIYHWQQGVAKTYDPPKNRAFTFCVQDLKGRLFAQVVGELEQLMFRWESDNWQRVGIKDNRGRYYEDTFYSAIMDPIGHLWVATRGGILIADGDGWWLPINGKEGLPYDDVRTLTFASGGDLWAGSEEGACRLRDGKWSYFWGKRWLPGNRVRAIAVDDQNNAWLATDQGISRIESVKMTLAEKAEHYEKIIAERHNRNGFVTICEFTNPEDTRTWQIEASDNDGGWTTCYAVAQCFQYAATKDPKARERARKSTYAIMDLERLSGIPGFHARSIIRKDEKRYFQSSGEWHESPVDPNYIWKGDTSSDEIDAHYFIYSVYYDLVADEKEKADIRAVVKRSTDHLLDNNYQLIDKDGKVTRWAIFNPEAVNDDPIWEEERGLNSLSILAHLKTAYHIVGDERYQQAYDDLIKRHHYLINAIMQKTLPPLSINHSDDELAFYCYYPLMIYENNPVYRRMWMMSFERSWQIERPERSAFFNFIYGAVTGNPCDAEASAQTLQEWPWDTRNWLMRNSHRSDITLDIANGRFNEPQSTRIVPYSERKPMLWNGNPYALDAGDPRGSREYDGTPFLLPYWMGRYWKIIQE